MSLKHTIKNITFHKDFIYLTIDGKEIKILIEKASKKLKAANEYQRMLYKIFPSIYGIHWPFIDEDLSINALLKMA